MNAKHQASHPHRNVLRQLRSLIPDRSLDFAETLALAERQAAQLLRIHSVASLPVPSEIVTDQPHIRVVHHLTPGAGNSHFNGHEWIITLNSRDPRELRRVTLLHEYAHIIWHGHEHTLFASDPYLGYLQAEQAADHFAWNTLMPTVAISEAWTAGVKHIGELAELFAVRDYNILSRLIQLRLWLPAHRRHHPHWSQLLHPAATPHRPQRGYEQESEAVA